MEAAVCDQGIDPPEPAPTMHAEECLAGLSFGPEDLPCLMHAMDEALAFLSRMGPVGPVKRREVALAILHRAKDGIRDPHRLAVKGVVGVI